jgi:hypothetical protein
MFAWWVAAPSLAQTVTFDLDEEMAQEIGIPTADLERQVGGAISRELNLLDPDSYLSAFANADAMAIKGMGVDYASNPKKFSIGGAVGSAVSNVPLSFSRGREELPEGGYAFMASVYAGVNLGGLSPGEGALDRVMLYVNGLAFQPPGGREFRGSMYNFGAHLQVKAVGPVDLKVVEWGGLDLTSGYERSFYELELTQQLPVSQQMGEGGEPATVTWTATGNYAISASSGTVPLELSTNLRLLMLTAYVGGAVDLNLADASSEASLAGPITVRHQGDDYDLGSAGVSLLGQAKADPFVPRAFVGAQINVSLLKLYGHLNLGLNETYGGFVGVRLAM